MWLQLFSWKRQPSYPCIAMHIMVTVLCLFLGVHGFPRMSCTSTGSVMTLEELERSVYLVAKSKDVAPAVILKRLLRKLKARQRVEQMRNRNLQELALNELLSTVVQVPPKSVVHVGLPPPREKPSKIGILPDNRFVQPTKMRTGSGPFIPMPGMEYSVNSLPGSPDLLFPAIGPPIFKPPAGVTIRVNPGGAPGVFPDVTVTISPMMTVVEALRQADAKFRMTLGVPETAEDIVNIGYSPFASCYVVDRFGDVSSSETQAWKISVSDTRGKEIYDSVCLPNRNEVPVKPGTTISLTYSVV